MKFKLSSNYKPSPAQIESIKKLSLGYYKYPIQTLLGITGSGKTFIIANVIETIQKPTLILAHNKTLAAQLYQELKDFFPENRVEYFISYYDYYQPESYVPTTDTYIEKEATVNSQIEKMRLKTMSALLSREDVIVVASISCIYGAGNPDDFKSLAIEIYKNQKISRKNLIDKFIDMLYERNQALEEGKFRIIGESIEIFPAYDQNIIRIELNDNIIEEIKILNPITKEIITKIDKIKIYPSKQFAIPQSKIEKAKKDILEELEERIKELGEFEAKRLKKKVKYDLELIEEMGYCSGIENYSRHFDQRKQGEPPYVLLDYFPKDFLLVIDESHQTIPQSNGMYNGDYSRKKNLVDFGFRLPSAFDNRPLKFSEFEKYFNHAIFVSATPSDYELEKSSQVIEQIIRPTGLLDPIVEVRNTESQIKDLINEINIRTKKNQRVLVTTLTKKMAEDLTNFLAKNNIKVRYMHSEIDSLDRIELIKELRIGKFDVLIGINLLREGLDIPEVSLVAILDADKLGFLRNEKSLIQTIGRAARNINGHVIMYAQITTPAMKNAIDKTKLRREKQIEYNKINNITPKTIIKSINIDENKKEIKGFKHYAKEDLNKKLIELDAQMKASAENLDFEKAIELRDTIENLKKEIKYL